MRKSHHVVPNPTGGWDVKVSGGDKAIKHTDIKQEAVDAARTISQNQESELMIHNKNGQIGHKDSHGHDPRSVNG